MAFPNIQLGLMAQVDPASLLLLDVEATTIPAFSIIKPLSSDFTGNFIEIVRFDGSANDTQQFAFENGAFPTTTVLTWLGTTTGLVSMVAFHNSIETMTQTTHANMPIIAENGSLITDASGRVAMKHNGNQWLTATGGYDLWSPLSNNQSPYSMAVEFQTLQTGTQRIFGNYGSNSSITFNLLTNGLSWRPFVINPGGKVKLLTNDTISLNTAYTIISEIDLLNATPADRCLTYINGATAASQTNTLSDTTAMNNLTPSLAFTFGQRGNGTDKYKGLLSSFVAWDRVIDRTLISDKL